MEELTVDKKEGQELTKLRQLRDLVNRYRKSRLITDRKEMFEMARALVSDHREDELDAEN